MKNRIISFILCLVMAVSLLPASVYAADDTPIQALSFETFDNYAVNEIPSNLSFDGLNARVIQRDKLNKALYGKSKGTDEFTLNLPISTNDKKLVLAFEAKIEGRMSEANLASFKTKQGTLTAIALREGGRIVLPGGKMIGGYYPNKWINYQLVIDFSKQLMDLYIDSNLAVSKFKFSYTAYDAPTDVNFSLSAPEAGREAEISLDNIVVYNGSKLIPISDFGSKGVSSKVLAYNETSGESKVGGLYLYHSFDEKGNLAFTTNDNTVELCPDPSNSSNMTLHVLRDQNNKTAMVEALIPTEMYEAKKFVLEFDFKLMNNVGSIALLELLDQSGLMVSAISSVNNVFYCSGRNATTFTIGKWTNVAIAFDNSSVTYDVYIDGVLKLDDVRNSYGAVQPFSYRTRALDSGTAEYYMDNLQVYTGSKLQSFTDEDIIKANNPDPILETKEDADKLIGTASVFMNSNNSMYIKGEKLFYDKEGYTPYMKGDSFMLPSSLIERAFDTKVGSVSSDIPSETKDGILYVSLTDYAEKVLKLYSSYDGRGFYMVDSKEIAYVNSISNAIVNDPVDLIYRYMFFDRPSGKTILEDFKKTTPDKSHPRLITDPKNVELIKGYINTDPLYRQYLDNTLKSANNYLSRTPVQCVYDTGSSFLNSARDFVYRVRTLGVAYTFTGDEIYAKGAWREMENIMGWENWNQDSYNYLDTSEISYGMSLGFDFLYDYLTREQKDKIIDMLFERSLDTTANAYRGRHKRLHWVTGETTNWSFVCNGGAISAALAIADEVDGKRLEKIDFILSNALQSTEHALMGFYPDGGWFEGPGYWQYSAMYLFGGCLAPLKYSCGTMYDLLDAKGVKDSLEQTMAIQSPNGMSFNYGDVAASFVEKDSIGFLVALLCENNSQMQSWRTSTEKRGAFGDERTLLWYRPDDGTSTGVAMPLDRYYNSTDVGTMRASFSIPEAAYVGVKGGLTAPNSHANLDAGSFIVDFMGIRWADELGFENYDIKSINYWTQHYWMYRTRPEGQNVVVINPRADIPDDGYFGGQLTKKYAPLIKNISKPRGGIMAFDLSEVYAYDTEKYLRGFLFGDDRQTLTIQDEITMKEDTNEVYWFMHTKGKIEISEDGKSVILTQDGKKVRVDAICDAPEWRFEDREVKPFPTSPQLSDQLVGSYEPIGIRKLTLKANAGKKVNITVKLSPVLEYEDFDKPTFSSLDSWDIPDGEIPEKPRATVINVNGALLNGFEPDRFIYDVDVPYGDPIPTITAQNNIGSIEVIQAPDFATPAKVNIMYGGKTISYTLNFRVTSRVVNAFIPGLAPTVGIPDGYSVKSAKNAAVSYVQQADANEAKIIDGDLTTRWAAEGYDQWAEIDLGEVMDISGVALCVYEGTKRQNIFKLLVSEDGISYTAVYDGKSSGKTLEWESYMFPSKARFIRYIGNQNTRNTWNSVNELAVIVKE